MGFGTPALCMACFRKNTSFRSSSIWKIGFVASYLLQLNPEFAALAERGLDANFGAHPFGGFADDGETDAGALVFRVGMNPFEQTKDSLLILRGNADPVVFEPKANRTIREVLHGDFDSRRSAGRNKFCAIAEQVGDALGQERFVPHDPGQRAGDANLRFDGLP